METTKYLIIGTGGVGGSIAAFLALAGHNVTCIARGAHLKAMRKNGLMLKSGLKGEHTVRVNACTSEEYSDKADVIFVCVKGYSIDSVTELIERAAHKDTIVIPILNVYGTGPKIKSKVKNVDRSRRMHLHCGIRFRSGRDYSDGKHLPPGIWCPQRRQCAL